MLEEIKNYEIEGNIMTWVEKCEIEQTFICLLKLVMGSCENERQIILDKDSEIVKSLRVLVIKMRRWGYKTPKLNQMITYATYDKNTGKNYGSISLNQLDSAGVEFLDYKSGFTDKETEKIKTILQKIYDEFSPIQKEYYELLYERKLPVTSVAKILGVKKGSVTSMKKTLIKLLEPLKEYHKIDTEGGITALGFKVNHHPSRESDKVNPYNLNPNLPFSKI